MATFPQYSSTNPYAVINSLVGGLAINGDELEVPLLAQGATLQTDGYGLRTFNGVFQYRNNAVSPNLALDWMEFRSGQELFSGTRLYVTKSLRRFRSGGFVEVEVEALGIDIDEIGGYETLPCTEGAGSSAANPVEMHPEFINRIGGTYKNRLNGAIFDPQTKKFTGFSSDLAGSTITNFGSSLAGTRSYLEPRRVIRGFIHADLENSRVLEIPQKIGKQTLDGRISEIRLVPTWQLPAGPESQSFLLTSANVEPLANVTTGQVGTPKIVKLNYELTVSGPLGWNNLLYDWSENE